MTDTGEPVINHSPTHPLGENKETHQMSTPTPVPASPTVTGELISIGGLSRIMAAITRPDIVNRTGRDDRIANVVSAFAGALLDDVDPGWIYNDQLSARVTRFVESAGKRLEALLETWEQTSKPA
jgi:hypothetical protein